jgi:CRP-like cAMP-binding protein
MNAGTRIQYEKPPCQAAEADCPKIHNIRDKVSKARPKTTALALVLSFPSEYRQLRGWLRVCICGRNPLIFVGTNPMSMPLSPIERLAQNFCPLSPASMADLQAVCTEHAYEKGQVLVREGQYADQLYFILEGCARAYYLKGGKDISDWFAFEDHFICAIVGYFLQVPSPHYIELLEPSRLLVIGRDDMQALCDKHHDIERLGRLSATATMLQLQRRVVSLQFESAQQRLENLLQIHPQIAQRVPLHHIASFLGITPETLSRVRAGKA